MHLAELFVSFIFVFILFHFFFFIFLSATRIFYLHLINNFLYCEHALIVIY